jgi:alpha-aminoadipic semialdehyde synthase
LNIIGLRKEEKSFEGRVPIVPQHAKLLTQKHGVQILLEPSDQRGFGAHEYEEIGVSVTSLKGSAAKVILGIKEMPIGFFEEDKVYIFFSHTIKGQSYNMPMLKDIIETKATLIDYERVIDLNGQRLIFFGNWAGLAGMSETLRLLGTRLEIEGINPNPFLQLKPTTQYKDLAELKAEFKTLREAIQKNGLPDELLPMVIGFAGYGNVSSGAQKMLDILPHKTIEPHELANLLPDSHHIYKCVFKEQHMVSPKDASQEFDLQDYYANGSNKYVSMFENHVPFLTILMNCIYWSSKYPRLVTKSFIQNHWSNKERKLKIIGDISCDVSGAIEFTMKCTDIGNPGYVYVVDKDHTMMGVKGDGPVIMAVDNLPAELPRESSTSFSETLLDFIPILARTDFTVPLKHLSLPQEIMDAVIVYRGQLTENYKYLEQYLSPQEKSK